jgi:predicted AlkP superfamily pyrophosphatase or phosphodiesterase
MQKILRHLLSLGLALALLGGCGGIPAPGLFASPSPFPPTPRPSLTPTAAATPTLTPSPSATITPSATPTPRPRVLRVLILSIDGLRPDAIALAPMPNLQMLMETGAYTLKAQTTFPSATLPGHTSMLLAACPGQHGVTWNDYLPANGYASGISLFALAKRYGMYTVMFVGKEKLRQITPPETTDYFRYINDRDLVLTAAAIPELQKGFDVAFLHFPTADWMGHEYGWLSPEQLSVLRRADEAIGSLMTALDESGLREGTLFIFTSDHGGQDQAHGSRRPEDMTIPWIVNGPGVVPGVIEAPVNIIDTAATAAWALRLPLPPEWNGLPVSEAFGESGPPRPEPRCP